MVKRISIIKKINMKRIFYITLLTAFVSGLLTSCENDDWEFADYEYTSVYFAYQSPVRTIVLGEDVFDTSLDNELKCQIMATMGGVYSNEKNVEIDISVDNALCDNLVFEETGEDVLPMPSDYYSLSSDRIVIEKGSVLGGVTVQLTEAFFNDPLALEANYVIPVRMTDVANADTILSGKPLVENPIRGVSSDWDVQPKDYILYAVKYINPYDGNYLRRGVDEITKDGVTETEVRHNEYVEDDEVVSLSTLSLNAVQFPMNYVSKDGHDIIFKLKLSFDDKEDVTVLPFETTYQVNDTVRVLNGSASGAGEFVKDGEKESWGNKDRDALYLDYDVSYQVEIQYPVSGQPDDIQEVSYSTVDTLVVRDRGVSAEWFTPVLKN
jgi:hypothetical protein